MLRSKQYANYCCLKDKDMYTAHKIRGWKALSMGEITWLSQKILQIWSVDIKGLTVCDPFPFSDRKELGCNCNILRKWVMLGYPLFPSIIYLAPLLPPENSGMLPIFMQLWLKDLNAFFDSSAFVFCIAIRLAQSSLPTAVFCGLCLPLMV